MPHVFLKIVQALKVTPGKSRFSFKSFYQRNARFNRNKNFTLLNDTRFNPFFQEQQQSKMPTPKKYFKKFRSGAVSVNYMKESQSI